MKIFVIFFSNSFKAAKEYSPWEDLQYNAAVFCSGIQPLLRFVKAVIYLQPDDKHSHHIHQKNKIRH